MSKKDQWPRLALGILCIAAKAHAVEISTGSPDLVVRWDNQIRYNLATRVERQDPNVLRSPNNDDGDRNFKKGSLVANRLDLFSEFDVTYQKRLGFRVSAAGWNDAAYNSLDGNSVQTSNHLVSGAPALGLSDSVKRLYQGPSGEILDAFVFGRFDLGEMPLNVKLGQHNLFWGETFFNPLHGVSYGQGALDLRKSAASPGTEAKELFRPRNALSGVLQVNPDLSVAGQYFLDWENTKISEPGTYRSATDFVLDGGESFIAGPNRFIRQADITPRKRGDWGLAAFLRPSWLDGSLGLYYRETSDMQPQAQINPVRQTLTFVYPDGIKIVGISMGTNLAGASIGFEANYRTGMPLNTLGVVSPAIPLPARGETNGPRGNTFHAVLNAQTTFNKTPMFDSAMLIAEVAFNRLLKVTDGAAFYAGNSPTAGLQKSTKDFVGVGISFTPTWFQVFPGVDLSMPMFVNTGVSGTSAIANGGWKGAGSYSIGLSAVYKEVYRFDLTYVDSFGKYETNSAGVITSNAGPQSLTKDRGSIGLTFKYTF